MDTPATELQLLADRIAKLERQNRFWKTGGVLAVLALASLLAVGVRAQQEWPTQRAKTIEAEAFVLMDANGVTKGEFGTKGGSPSLQLYGSNGKVIWSTNPRMVIQGQ